ncbi:NUDIX domain-containing protein, partial [Nocardia brasiliensis]|uniref:NUDIX domain-containing protein n=1 Tax=Nocardia brasiliensis TaxID=37326 RepID=UPI0024556FDA
MTTRHLVDAHVLLIRDGRLLLSKRRGADEFDGRWHLPAGKVEVGESASAPARPAAHEDLPRELEQARSGGATPEIARVDVHTTEEIGQLARAVDDIHQA